MMWKLGLAVSLALVCLANAQLNSQFTKSKEGVIKARIPHYEGVSQVFVTIQEEPSKIKKQFTVANKNDVENTWTAFFKNFDGVDLIKYTVDFVYANTDIQSDSGIKFFGDAGSGLAPLGEKRFLKRASQTVFYDDFSGGSIDGSKWKHDINVGNPGSFTIASPEHKNSYIHNGKLYIKPTFTTEKFGDQIMGHGTIDARQQWGDCIPTWSGCWTHDGDNRPIMSAQLRSDHSQHGHIKYGKVEIVAKLPRGDWLWPALWMMPTEPSAYGGWPKSGEFDILEAAGNQHYTFSSGSPVGIQCAQSHIHYGSGFGDGAKSHGDMYCLNNGDFHDDFHTFWLDWAQGYIRIGVDDHWTFAMDTPSQGFWNEAHLNGWNIWEHGAKNAPFDQPFYIMLANSVGGDFFWDGWHNRDYDRPWTHSASDGGWREFWNNRNKWMPTWHGDDIALQVKSVKLQQYL